MPMRSVSVVAKFIIGQYMFRRLIRQIYILAKFSRYTVCAFNVKIIMDKGRQVSLQWEDKCSIRNSVCSTSKYVHTKLQNGCQQKRAK